MERIEASSSELNSSSGNVADCYSVDSDDVTSKFITSPGCTQYWVPICVDMYKPYLGQKFSTFEEGYDFYYRYGHICGFDVRRNTEKKSSRGHTILRYFVCNREEISAFKTKTNYDGEGEGSGKRRKNMYSRCACNAKVGLKLLGKDCGVEVYVFVEQHNHELVKPIHRQFLKSSRKMTAAHKSYAYLAGKMKIGPSKAHALLKEQRGSYESVGAMARDFRNWNRDLKQIIGDKDSQIILDKFKVLNEKHGAFYYEYDVDDSGRLTKLFWADPIGRRNYEVFGDVISFDATFGTNKYNMIFVPFCGVDNHWKCVTFAAGLLSREDIPHYTWVFQAFVKAMGREPVSIITDQCPAMKQAIPAVFTTTRHRWCMWHIMNKLPAKVGPQLCQDADLMSKIKGYVWNEDLSASEFEDGWKSVIEEFNLKDNDWLSSMFENRSYWVPAYFRDSPLLGILRTTSWSESANSFFGKYNMEKDSLTEFYVRFETAMEKQRQTTKLLNHECLTSLPTVETPLLIEKDAAEIYTRKMFYRIREEMKEACFSLGMKCMDGDDLVKNLILTDGKANRKDFEVRHALATNHVSCSCKLFERLGILCRHAFFALKLANVYKISREFVVNRWTKNAERRVSSAMLDNVSADCGRIESVGVKLNEIWFHFNSIMALVGTEDKNLDHLCDALKDMKLYYREQNGTNVVASTKTVVENLIGSEIPEDVTIKPPNEARNKGCGRKRFMSSAEKSIIQREKAKRLCRSCNQLGNHDKRNCPLLNKE